jgi:tetratricopeptide (TPR) repeat protein
MEATIRQSAVGETEMAEWELPFKSVLGCLLQAGLLAARNGMRAEAEAILRPVEAVRPSHASTRLARGLVGIYQERYQEAIDGLEKGLLKEDPDHDMGRAIKALGLYHLGRTEECRGLIKGLRDQDAKAPATVSPQARNLAASLASEIGMAA